MAMKGAAGGPVEGEAAEKPLEIETAGSSGDTDSIRSAIPPTANPDGPAVLPPATAAAEAKPETNTGLPEEGRTQLQTILIMLSLCSALFLAALDVTIVTVAVPTISEQFQSTVGYTWIGSAYLLANAASSPTWGKISDIWGRKQILLVAVAVFWVGSLLSAISVSMAMLIAARAIQGVGGGGIVILVNVSISDLFSMRKRGMYFGMMGMVWAVAGGIGPIIGGAFTDRVSWRWCFYINLPISGAGFAILLFVLKLHNPRTPMRQGLAAVDWIGSITIIGGTIMLLLGLTFGGVVYPWNSATVICLIVFGVVVMGLFVVVEWKVAKYPIIPLHLFKKPAAVATLAASFCHGYVFISGSYYLPLYFQAVIGADPFLSGAYILPWTVTLAVFSAGSGIFIRKTGKYLPAIIFGFVLMTLGFGLFVDLGHNINWPKIILYQMIAAVGVGPNFQAPLISLQTTVEQRDIASATATFAFLRQLSTSISVVVGGVVFQNGMEKQYASLLEKLGPEIANLLSGSNAAASVGLVSKLSGEEGEVARGAYWNSMRSMFIMYVVFSALGLIVALFIGQRTLDKEHEEHKTGLQGMIAAKKTKDEAERPTKEDEESGVAATKSGR